MQKAPAGRGTGWQRPSSEPTVERWLRQRPASTIHNPILEHLALPNNLDCPLILPGETGLSRMEACAMDYNSTFIVVSGLLLLACLGQELREPYV